MKETHQAKERRKKARWHFFDLFKVATIFQWTLLIFMLVTLPLVLTQLYSLQTIQGYTEKSHKTLFQTLKVANNHQILRENILLMERSIRQFEVLDDPEIYQVFLSYHQEFIETAAATKTSALPENLQKALANLIEGEAELFYNIQPKSPPSPEQIEIDEIIKKFTQLKELANKLISKNNRQIRLEAKSLSELADTIEEKLLFAVLTSITLALTLGLFLLLLINKPFKNIQSSINNLGHSQFNKRIFIEGPKDLKAIGQDLEWLRNRLIELEESKQSFIKTISHELKTPLATLMEGTDLLQEQVAGELNTEQKKIVRLLRIANIRLNALIENLLEYQKMTTTSSQLRYTKFKIGDLIKQICYEYQLLIDSKKIHLEIISEPIDLIADRDKIRIIFSNLFSNALKYTPQSGQILIKVKPMGYNLQLLIADQGPGIKESQRDQVFSEFYKHSSPDNWKIKGSGLGLNLVKSYVSAHQGQIDLLKPDNEYPGARFLISLPLAPKTILTQEI